MIKKHEALENLKELIGQNKKNEERVREEKTSSMNSLLKQAEQLINGLKKRRKSRG